MTAITVLPATAEPLAAASVTFVSVLQQQGPESVRHSITFSCWYKLTVPTSSTQDGGLKISTDNFYL